MKHLFEMPRLFSVSGAPVSGEGVFGENACTGGSGDNNGCTLGSGQDNGCKYGTGYRGNGCTNGGDEIDTIK